MQKTDCFQEDYIKAMSRPSKFFYMYLEMCTFASFTHLEFQVYPFSVMTDTILSHVSDVVMQTLSHLCLLSPYCSALPLSTSPLLHQTQIIYLCFSWHISNLSTCYNSGICLVRNVKLLWLQPFIFQTSPLLPSPMSLLHACEHSISSSFLISVL